MGFILAIDTVTNLCHCALYPYDGAFLQKNNRLDSELKEKDEVKGALVRSCEDIGKGHGEHLMGQIEGLLRQVGMEKSAIGRIGVNIGPGSFTGMRIGVAVARAMALALGIDAVGISRFEALHHGVRQNDRTMRGWPCAVILTAGQDRFYVQIFDGAGHPLSLPYQATEDVIIAQLPRPVLIAAAAGKTKTSLVDFLRKSGFADCEIVSLTPEAELDCLAALSCVASPAQSIPSPLYMRPPDAKQNALALSSLSPIT